MWLKPTYLVLPFFFQFFSQDLPLFEGIVSDLFPGITLPSPDHGVLEEALKRNIRKMGLQAVPWFVDKVIQVYRLYVCIDIVAENQNIPGYPLEMFVQTWWAIKTGESSHDFISNMWLVIAVRNTIDPAAKLILKIAELIISKHSSVTLFPRVKQRKCWPCWPVFGYLILISICFLRLRFLLSFTSDKENISNTKTMSAHFSDTSMFFKILRRYASCFQVSTRSLEMWSSTVFHVLWIAFNVKRISWKPLGIMITQTGRAVLTIGSCYDFINNMGLSSQHEVLLPKHSLWSEWLEKISKHSL